jgi:hypothetical protein
MDNHRAEAQGEWKEKREGDEAVGGEKNRNQRM